MGFPLGARLARFSWGPSSAEMANLYFDRTIQVSAASFGLFGPPPSVRLVGDPVSITN